MCVHGRKTLYPIMLSSLNCSTYCISKNSLPALLEGLHGESVGTYVIDADDIANEEDALHSLAVGLQFPKECFPMTNLHGTLDFAWQELTERPEAWVVIIIRNTHRMLSGERLQLFFNFLDWLYDLRESVDSPGETPSGHSVDLRFVLLGEGPGFPEWRQPA